MTDTLPAPKAIRRVDTVTIRFAGDSGDGMQLTGDRFTSVTALAGNDLATLPDFPAEIRAPAGSLPGVSGFQLHFADHDVLTPGDEPDVLVAMNPAALKTNVTDVAGDGLVIANADAFTRGNLKKAAYAANPLDADRVEGRRVVGVPITTLTMGVLEEHDLTSKEKQRAKNMFALGLVSWMFSRATEPTEEWLRQKFSRRPEIAEANVAALRAGLAFGETTELFAHAYEVRAAKLPPGTYRQITGNTALAYGLIAAARRADLPLFLGSYPITPASDILHELSRHKRFGVTTFQAEDEIAAVGAALGAAFGGALAVTTTSGPGVALKGETIGLAVAVELPLIIINVQRGGPSTGLPTKTEQSDLLQAMYGRNGEAPLPIVAPAGAGDCVHAAVEAARIALTYRTPVMLLSDGYLANGAEPWRLPSVDELPDLRPVVAQVEGPLDPDTAFLPFERDPATLARPWATPGTPGYEHRIGGLEKADVTGTISYDPENHHRMTELRAAKVAGVASSIEPFEVDHGEGTPRLLVLGWGSTRGPIHAAVRRVRRAGHAVARAHLRHLNPFPRGLVEALRHYDRVLVPEMNMGQLSLLLRAATLVDVRGHNRVRGQPFPSSELEERILAELAELSPAAAPPAAAPPAAANGAAS